MKGSSEHGGEELDAATPQVTRNGVIFTALVFASKATDGSLRFLDFTKAFHSGDPIEWANLCRATT